MIGTDDGGVLVVDPGRHVSSRFEKAAWWRRNQGDIHPLEDFVGAARALAQARSVATAPSRSTPPSVFFGASESDAFAWVEDLEDGWDDRCVRSIAPLPTQVDAARRFVARHSLQTPHVDVDIEGSVTLVHRGASGEVRFAFDRCGRLTGLIEHGDVVVTDDDLPERLLVELGVGLVRYWDNQPGSSRTTRTVVILATIEQGHGRGYLLDLDAQIIQRTYPDDHGDGALAVLSQHADDVLSIARPRLRGHAGPNASLACRTEDGLLECRLSDLGVELIDVEVARLPQAWKAL